MEAVVRKNYNRSAPEMAVIFVCTIARTKKVVVLESREIARVA